MNDAAKQLWLVVPAFNEADVVASTVRSAAALWPNIVLIDDGSSDETGLQAEQAGAIVVKHPVNLGQGAAIQTGIDFALGQKAEFIATFDADGQHSAADIETMLAQMHSTGVDVVLGSRFKGHTVAMPQARGWMLRLATAVTRFNTGLNLSDTHNGLRLFRASAAQQLNIKQAGMAHASEILETISRLGLSYIEAPVTVTYSEYSLSKGQRMSNSIRILSDLIARRLSK